MKSINITTFLLRKPTEHQMVISNECISIANAVNLLESNELVELASFYQSIDEYDDIDFTDAQISLEKWTTESLLVLPFPKWSKSHWEEKINNSTESTFSELDLHYTTDMYQKRIGYWEQHGTWSTPIVIIQLSDFLNCSKRNAVQLFEGHNRLFRLNILNKFQNVKLQKEHLVFVICKAK